MSDTLDEVLLETMIDAHGLPAVLQALERICYKKADHVRSNWQDEGLAKSWEIAARPFDGLADKVARLLP